MEADSFRDRAHRKRLITETDAQKTALSQGASNNINPNYLTLQQTLGASPPKEEHKTKPHPEADFPNFSPQNP